MPRFIAWRMQRSWPRLLFLGLFLLFHQSLEVLPRPELGEVRVFLQMGYVLVTGSYRLPKRADRLRSVLIALRLPHRRGFANALVDRSDAPRQITGDAKQ